MSYKCPVCAEPINIGDMCSMEIDMGSCHAECLDESQAVDLSTGEPIPGPVAAYEWTQQDADEHADDVPVNENGETIQ